MSPSATSTSEVSPETISTSEGDYLEAIFPDIARSMGANSVTHLREITCAGDTASGPTAARKTSWMARAEVTVTDADVAREVADNVRAEVEKHGWTTSENPADVGDQGSFAGTRLLSAKLEDPDLVMTVLLDEDRDGTLIVANQVRGICRDMPEGHKMVRSPLDPEYGAADLAYEETDSIEDYTGLFKPLPTSTQTPAPTGPAGASPVGKVTQ